MLEFQNFLNVVRDAPLVSIDLLVRNESGQYLLGLRLNEPAKGQWFVPGGRVCKNETLDQAFERLTTAELGRSWQRAETEFKGVYEHFYDTNAGQQPGFGTHYVVLAHELNLSQADLALPAEQHAQWRWADAAAIANDETASPFTRDYFHDSGRAGGASRDEDQGARKPSFKAASAKPSRRAEGAARDKENQ